MAQQMADSKLPNQEELFAEILDSEISACSATLTLLIKDNLCYFSGHFPSFPILPGVVQIEWAVKYLGEFLHIHTPVLSIERLKFTNPIQPNMHVKLHLTKNTDQSFAQFHFYAQSSNFESISFSQGRFVYE
jgi:3-hydroxymyristoyl/3-hydroxydecanoyl-(acyl carrier protein) dehydratase